MTNFPNLIGTICEVTHDNGAVSHPNGTIVRVTRAHQQYNIWFCVNVKHPEVGFWTPAAYLEVIEKRYNPIPFWRSKERKAWEEANRARFEMANIGNGYEVLANLTR